MEEIIKILKDVFGNNTWIILAVALCWIPIYFLKRLYDFAAPIVLIRWPSFRRAKKWNDSRAIKAVLKNIKKANTLDQLTIDNYTKKIEAAINHWEVETSKIQESLNFWFLLD